MSEPSENLRDQLPLLEHSREESELDDSAAAVLVAFALDAWSDHWAASALDWVDQGVWSEGVAEALRRCSQNHLRSQFTRHRAWHYIKDSFRPPTS